MVLGRFLEGVHEFPPPITKKAPTTRKATGIRVSELFRRLLKVPQGFSELFGLFLEVSWRVFMTFRPKAPTKLKNGAGVRFSKDF